METNPGMSDEILIAIRRVIRAVDVHSRKLNQNYKLTGPQALVLKKIHASRSITPGELARMVSLSQATISDIIKRLEQRGYVRRIRDLADRRKIMLQITNPGRNVIKRAPPLLQEEFTHRLCRLENWEQTLLLSSLQRVASLMDAEELDASPILSSEPAQEVSPGAENIVNMQAMDC